MILSGSHASPELFARFRAEAEAVARLQHPNIVQIYEIGEAEDHPFFSLEFVGGGSLAQQLTGAPQPPVQSAHLIRTLALAMRVAHESGIVHRDLKPGNILLSGEWRVGSGECKTQTQEEHSKLSGTQAVAKGGGTGISTTVSASRSQLSTPDSPLATPKISDFGLAKRLDDQSGRTQSGSILGTPSYMAPEQAEGKVKEIGPLVDIYALGAILYELLTGRVPFRGESVWDTLQQVRTQEPVAPTELQPRVPRDLETICLKCLQKEPRKRYASAAALAEDLRRFEAGEPIVARPVGAPERLWRWCRRNPRLAMLSGAVAVLLVTVAATALGFAWQLKREKDQTEAAWKQADDSARAEAQARQLADQKASEANTARQLAQDNAKVAVDQHSAAIDQLLHLVEKLHKRLSKKETGQAAERQLQALREEINAMALDSVAAMSRDVKRSGLTSFSMLRAHFQMGNLLLRLGQGEESFRQYQLALDNVRAVAQKEPDNDKARGNLALVLAVLGRLVLEWHADARAAREYFLQALQVHEDLRARPRSAFYKEVDHWRLLSGYHHDLGVAAVHLGDPEAAQREFLQTLALREKWLQADTQNNSARIALAQAYCSSGDVSWRLGDFNAACEYLGKGLAICESLVHHEPKQRAWKLDLAEVCESRGDVRLRFGEIEEAHADYQRSLLLLQELAGGEAEEAGLSGRLGRAHYRMATCLLRLGKRTEADKDFERALQLQEQASNAVPGNLRHQAELMLAMVRCGRHAQAAQHVQKLSESHPHQADVLFNVARCYAICASPPVAGSTERQQMLEKSLRALRDLVDQGWRDRLALETDPDLDAISSEPAFRHLLKQLSTR
jgi:serine/threonine-protein kinase